MVRKVYKMAFPALIAMAIILTSQPAFSAENAQDNAGLKRNGMAQSGEIRFKDDYGTAEVVSGNFKVLYGADYQEKALAFIADRPAAFKIDSPAEELELISQKSDDLGKTHLSFQQVYRGIPVWGSRTIVHFEDAQTIYMVAGQTVPTPGIDIKPNINDADASSNALNEMSKTLNNNNLVASSDLIIYPFEKDLRLVHLITVTSPTDGSIRWRLFVDAQTGDIIDKFNDIHFDGPDVGTGPDVLNTMQSFPIYLQSGNYIMWDATRPTYIFTYEDFYNGGPISTDPDGDKVWDDNTGQKAAVSGHVYAGMTIDYFNSTFSWNSYDNMGSDLIVNVHDPVYVNNAYWNGYSLNFADGDGVNYLPFSGSLDVVAHEFGHGVTEYTAGLIYRFQSGALNESYSDVFGACVDRDDWLLGEDIRLASPGFIRSMEDPTLRGHPSHMDDYIWYGIETDNGGVHINSGIPNHAFYWASSLTSREVAEQIWFRTLSTYLTPSSGMYFWAAMIVQAAADLHGEGSSEYNNILLALSQVGFNSTYAVPDEMTLSNIVGTVSYDTIWIQNPTSNTVSVAVTIPPSLSGLNVTAPSSIGPDDSGAVALTYDSQSMDECDIGLYSDRLQITTTGAPYNSNIYIPIDILVGYTTTGMETVGVNTACLSFTGRNTSGFSRLSRSGVDAVYDGSLMIGVKDGTVKTAYREIFGNLSLIPVDTIAVDTTGKSFRIATSDGRIQGSVKYRWYDGADPDTCGFIIAEYTLENVCDTTLTVYPGLMSDFDINNSGNNIADYEAPNDLVYMKDNSSQRTAGFAMLSGSAYNLRAIHNPDLVWGNSFTDNVAYDQLSASSNVDGLSPSDYSALLSFGPVLLKANISQTFSVALLYSTTGVSGLTAALEMARAFNQGITIDYGDANSDGSVNVADAVFIINYVFKGGPAPDPLENGDANCDGDVNVADGVYIINYVFKGGPEPGCP